MKKSNVNIKAVNLIIIIILIIISLFFEILKLNADLIEKIFPNNQSLKIKSYIFKVFDWVNFSVAEILIFIALILIVFFSIYFIINVVISKSKIIFVINFCFKVIIIIGILYTFFMVFCGLDYYRIPIEKKINLQVRKYDKQELISTCNIILKELNLASDNVKRGYDGLFETSMDQEQIFDFSKNAYKILKNEKLVEDVELSKPKKVYFSEALNYLSIRGFYFPFTGEANINSKEGEIFIPFVICHEKAHQYGIMREQEASFVAFLACIKSDNNDFVYSGYLEAFITILNQVYSEDKDEYKRIILNLDEKVINDINDYNEKMSKYKGTLGNISNVINNSYLISQGQKDGIKSYGKMVDLLISKYTK